MRLRTHPLPPTPALAPAHTPARAVRSLARMLNENRRDNLLVSVQFNLARSEAIHPALKEVRLRGWGCRGGAGVVGLRG